MKIKEMIQALQLSKSKNAEHALCTPFSEKLSVDNLLKEYPRPQLEREQYEVLNGLWDYSITKSNEKPDIWDGKILVPFSPEAPLSGVNRQLMPDEVLWYQKRIQVEKEANKGKRFILHFGAVDERCRLYINGTEVYKHAGGYLAFETDITDFLNEGENVILLSVYDKTETSYHSRGKQMLKKGGMFYTAQSGIWQTVWYEWVPDKYVTSLKIVPLFDTDEVKIEVKANKLLPKTEFSVQIFEEGNLIAQAQSDKETIIIKIPNKRSWSPVSPFLYDLKIKYGEDEFKSYFGMRKFSVEKDSDGIPRLCLNNVPYFQKGVLDQGYWPESLLTPPSEEAIIYDIEAAKRMGFNMIRKHCKIEPLRWYYHCDRLGMLVWQDMINGGDNYNLLLTTYLPTALRFLRDTKDKHYLYTARRNEKGRAEWKRECKQTIKQLINVTSICTWVLFNEGWGQFDAVNNTRLARSIDDTRFIDAHSGWFDQKAGDMKSEHIYFFDLLVKRTSKPYVISEYGGLILGINGHTYSDNYFGYETYNDKASFKKAYDTLQEGAQILIRQGLCATVYTQLTDIEEEVNGLITYDRKIEKL